MTTTAGIKLHKAIVAALATPFDGSPSKLQAFLDEVRQRASNSGWTANLLSISNQDPVNPVNYNLILHHRMLTLDNVRAHAATYIGQQTRLAQDSFMMYEFLHNSFTDTARIRLSVKSDKFEINNIQDGPPSYLKVLLIKFYVETNATNFHLRECLHHLPLKMKELKSNVANFNDYVQNIVSNLPSGGQTSSDLIVFLFLAYLEVEDSTFKKFIKRRKEEYDDGKEEITVQSLMDQALNKFNQLNENKTWKTKTPEEQQLIALTAQHKEAKDKIAELSKSKSSSSAKAKSTKETPTDKSSSANNGKHKSKSLTKDKLPQWRFERTGNQTKMTSEDKTYFWCEFHGYWCSHEEKDCKAKKKKGDKPKSDSSKDSGSSVPSALNNAKALIAVTKASDGNTDSNQEDKE